MRQVRRLLRIDCERIDGGSLAGVSDASHFSWSAGINAPVDAASIT